jgi:hypothetical protein
VIKSIATFRHVRLLGFAAGAVAVAVGAVWITASAAGFNVGFLSAASPSPKPPTSMAIGGPQKTGKASAVCDDFVKHFAADLGSTQTKVDSAFQKAIGQTLDDEVKNGDITQPQADAIKKKIAGQAPCTLLPAPATKPPSSGGLAAYGRAFFSAEASALGITDQQLKADLAQGMSLSQIAAAQNPPVTEAQFRALLIAKLTPMLDAAVAGKQITTAQEKAIIQQLQTGPIPFWSKPTRPATKPAGASPSPGA